MNMNRMINLDSIEKYMYICMLWEHARLAILQIF